MELDEARERERRAVEERDRLAAETEAARLAEEERRRLEAEHAAEHERATAAEATRHEEERERTEAAAASAAEAARLETQRLLISDEVDRLKAERRRLEAELRSERDATAGQVDPKVAGATGAGAAGATTGATAGSPASGSSGQEGSWSASAMGSSNTAGGANAARSATSGTTKTKAAPRPGDWMANRQAPNRTPPSVAASSAGRCSWSGSVCFSCPTIPLPQDAAGGEQYFNDNIVPLLVLAVITIFTASIAGALIEQYVPPLRAPAGDISRWPVVLVLGMTLGPLSIVVADNVYEAFIKPLGDVEAGQVFGVSVLAFLLAELFMGRGKSSTSSR